jgi:hypothetical protein
MARMNPDKKADIEADRQGAASERHEPISLMEPILISESSRFRNGPADLAVEIAARSAASDAVYPEELSPPWLTWSVQRTATTAI